MQLLMVLSEAVASHHLSWPETVGGSGHCPSPAHSPGVACAGVTLSRCLALLGVLLWLEAETDTWVSMAHVSEDIRTVWRCSAFVFWGVE